MTLEPWEPGGNGGDGDPMISGQLGDRRNCKGKENVGASYERKVPCALPLWGPGWKKGRGSGGGEARKCYGSFVVFGETFLLKRGGEERKREE